LVDRPSDHRYGSSEATSRGSSIVGVSGAETAGPEDSIRGVELPDGLGIGVEGVEGVRAAPRCMNLRFKVEEDSPGMVATRGSKYDMKQMGQDKMVSWCKNSNFCFGVCVLTSSFNVFLK